MEQIAENVAQKLHQLTPEQLERVDEFIEALSDGDTRRSSLLVSERAFGAVWSNPEDDVYNAV